MTTNKLKQLFESDDDYDSLSFDKIENKRSKRADLHAFLLLDELVPDTTNMVTAGEHDQIFLEVNIEDLAKVINEDQVFELKRCGVFVDEYGLSMFV